MNLIYKVINYILDHWLKHIYFHYYNRYFCNTFYDNIENVALYRYNFLGEIPDDNLEV